MGPDSEGEPEIILRLDAGYQALVRAMLDDLAELIEDPGAAGPEVAKRLNPDAHPDDPIAEDDYRSVVGTQLREERLVAMELMRASLDAADGCDEEDHVEAAAAEVFGTVRDLAGDSPLGSRLEMLAEVWADAEPEGPIRSRVSEELVRLCADGARAASGRGDAAAEAAWVSAAARAEWMPLAAGGIEVHLGTDELEAWMVSVNHVRLALGTMCGVSEDEEDWNEQDPRAPLLQRYVLLSQLLAYLVDVAP